MERWVPMTHSRCNPIENKPLEALTPAEWESLCDHCGLCCLQKFEDARTGRIRYIGVACDFLDIHGCECLVYENRHFANPDCIALTQDNIRRIKWLPETCAYRCRAEGRPLAWWHPLKSGDPATVHQAGISVRDKAVSGCYLSDRDLDIDAEI